MSRVGVLLVATGKYDVFLQPLIDSMEKYFFQGEDIDIYIFSDKKTEIVSSDRIHIKVMRIDHYPFPYATLYRYKHFNSFKDLLISDYLFYLDVDMKLVGIVDEEILSDITCVRHPGFWRGGWGSDGCSIDSLAYLTKDKRIDYKAGGFQGGKRDSYLKACAILDARIQDDEKRGIMAEWHDETHWNWYLKTLAPEAKTLDCGYCYPEARWAMGMPFVRKIIALEKNHGEIRKLI